MSQQSLGYREFFYNCKAFGFRTTNELVNLMADQYELRADQESEFLHFTGRLCKTVLGGLQQRKVDIKSIKQQAQPGNSRCVVNLFIGNLKCIPESGRFYRKPLVNVKAGDIRYSKQPIGINILTKYLQSKCAEVQINMEGRGFSNHSGKVTCATRLYESGQFDKQTKISPQWSPQYSSEKSSYDVMKI